VKPICDRKKCHKFSRYPKRTGIIFHKDSTPDAITRSNYEQFPPVTNSVMYELCTVM